MEQLLGDGGEEEEEGEGEDLFGDNFERCVGRKREKKEGNKRKIKEGEKGRKRIGCVSIVYIHT